MNNVLDITRKVLFGLLVVFVFLTWFTYSVKTSVAGYSIGDELTVRGFATLGGDIGPIALVIIFFTGGSVERKNKLYFYAAIGGFVLTLLTGLIYPQYLTAVKVSGVSEKVTWGVGLWLTLLDYIALGVISYLELKKSQTEDKVVNTVDAFMNKVNSVIPKNSTSSTGQSTQQPQATQTTQTSEQSQVEQPSQINDVSQMSREAKTTQRDSSNESNKVENDFKFCSQCGEKLKKEALFCTKCGRKL